MEKERNSKLLEEYLHLPLMERMNQYIDELKKEKISITLYLDDTNVSPAPLDIRTLEELFQ